MYRKIALLAAFLLVACGDTDSEPLGPTWFDDPNAELPESLSGFGVFDGNAIGRDDVVHAYEPRYPLWSAGATKWRAVAVPRGTSIDNSTGPSSWVSPVGTIFFKTFEWEGAPVETRVMRKIEDDWEFAAYLWDADGADAQRLEMRRSTPVDVTWEGQTFEHRVPNENDCRKCHEPTDQMTLGFDDLQLGDQLGALVERGIVEQEPVNRRKLPGGTELERQIMGGFVGNCTNCHNGSEHDQASFDLSPEVAFENVIDRATESSASAAGTRVVPGRPEESILYLAISGTSDDPEIKEMPPVGLEIRDEAFVGSVGRWIEGLGTTN